MYSIQQFFCREVIFCSQMNQKLSRVYKWNETIKLFSHIEYRVKVNKINFNMMALLKNFSINRHEKKIVIKLYDIIEQNILKLYTVKS